MTDHTELNREVMEATKTRRCPSCGSRPFIIYDVFSKDRESLCNYTIRHECGWASILRPSETTVEEVFAEMEREYTGCTWSKKEWTQ